MPFDGSGNFQRIHNWVADAAAAIKIRADRHDGEDDNFASGLSMCLTKDGQTQPTANIPMNGKKITNLAAPTVNTDAVNKAYVDAVRTFASGITVNGPVKIRGTGDPAQAYLFFDKIDGSEGALNYYNESLGTLNWRFAAGPTTVALSATEFKVNTTAKFTEQTTSFEWNDSGASVGPTLYLDRISGNPAVNDFIGQISFRGRNSAAALTTYADVWVTVTDPVNNSEDAHVTFRRMVGGALLNALVLNTNGAHFFQNLGVAGDLNGTGAANFTGQVTAGQVFAASGANVILAGNAGIFFRPNGAGSTVGQSTLSTAGGLSVPGGLTTGGTVTGAVLSINGAGTFGGQVTANQNFVSSTGNVVLAATAAAGSLFLRPNGFANTAGQAVLASTGNLSVDGAVAAAGNLSAVSNVLSINASLVLAATGNGQITLRPNGAGVAAGQAFLATGGNFTISGTGVQPGGGPWAATSDERIKTVVGDYAAGLDAVMALRPVVYTFKGNDTMHDPQLPVEEPASEHQTKEFATVPFETSPNYTAALNGTEFVGLIAQEVEAAMPEMVSQFEAYIDGEPVTDMRKLDTTPLIFAVINAIKQLVARIETLEGASA